MISVLYIDDEPSLLAVTAIYLQQEGGFNVDTAESPLEGMDKLKLRHYDAIISDYDMPDMDGVELLKLIRSQYPLIPFIIFTGKGREEIVIEALNNGADFYLQKGGDPSVQFTELANVIRHLVRRNRAEYDALQSEHRLKTFLNSLSDFAFIKDDNKKFIFINSAFQKFLGLNTIEEAFGKTDSELLPSDLASICIRAQSEVAGISSPLRFIDMYQGRKFRFHIFPLPFSESSTGIGGIIRDVTNGLGLLGPVQMQENLYHNLIELLDDPVIIFNKKHRIVYVNPVAEEETGISMGDSDQNYLNSNINSSLIKKIDDSLKEVFMNNREVSFQSEFEKEKLYHFFLKPASKTGNNHVFLIAKKIEKN